jgi:hypothetical protein
MTEPRNDPSVKPDEPEDDGDATPHWAELPQLDVRDQASMSMAFRFPPLPTLAPQETAGGGGPRDFVVVRDEFAALRQLEKLREAKPPAEVSSAPLVYGIVVRNTTPITMHEVRIEHDLPPGVRYLSSDPPARLVGRRLVWDVGLFEPGTKQRFKIQVQPNRPDSVTPESRADFRVYQCLHNQTRLLRPHVSLRVHVPSAATVGETVPLAIEATNAGPGSAEDVRLVVAVPQGLRHARSAVLQFERDRLGPREQFQAQTELQVDRAGSWSLQVHCLGNGKVLSSTSAVIQAQVSDHASSSTPTNEGPYFLLEVAGRLWAVPLPRMIEVHRSRSLTSDVRTIDLREKLGQAPGGSPGRIVLVRDGTGRPLALSVDRTLGVVRLQGPSGEARHDGQPVTILDIDALLADGARSLVSSPAEEATLRRL